MLDLDVTTVKTMEVVLSGVPSAQLPWTTHWVDLTATTQTAGCTTGVTNSAVVVTVVAAPAALTQRVIKGITIFGIQAATITVTFQIVDAGVTRIIHRQLLNPGECLKYDDGRGWFTTDTAGSEKITAVALAGYATILNVKDYGAAGDGATDDTTAIQAAIAAAIALGGRGGALWFPTGVYKTSATLTVVGNNVSLLGPGQGACVILPAAAFLIGDIFQFGNGVGHSAFEFRGIQIFSANARTSGAGININAANDVKIDDFGLNNMVVGFLIQGASLKVSISNGTINDTLAATGIGIRVLNGLGGDTYLGPNIVWSNPPASKPLAGISLEQTGHTSIVRCNVTSCVYGIQMVPAGVDVSYVFIEHSLFDSCGTAGMYVNPTALAASRVRSVICTNSWFSGSTTAAAYGIWIVGGANSIIDDLKFNGCRILNNQNHGVFINPTNVAGCQNLAFINCSVMGNGQVAGNTWDGFNIVAALTRFSIVNCVIGTGGTAPAAQQRYAINIAAGAGGYFSILGNDCTGNGTAPFINNAATGPSQVVSGNPVGYSYPVAIKNLTAPVASVAAAETLLMNAQVGANAVRVGSTFRIRLEGVSSSTGTLIFRVRVGTLGTVAGDAQAWISTTSVAQVANAWGGFDVLLTIRTLGAPGSAQAAGCAYAGAVVLPQLIGAAATVAVTPGAAWYIDVSVLSSVGTFTAHTCTIEQV
jgi:hypothetical protein